MSSFLLRDSTTCKLPPSAKNSTVIELMEQNFHISLLLFQSEVVHGKTSPSVLSYLSRLKCLQVVFDDVITILPISLFLQALGELSEERAINKLLRDDQNKWTEKVNNLEQKNDALHEKFTAVSCFYFLFCCFME